MDTLSLSKMGANIVGVDFSEEAIQTAKSLNEELGLNAQFCCCNIYDAPTVLKGQKFDIVYTSSWCSYLVARLNPMGTSNFTNAERRWKVCYRGIPSYFVDV